MHSKLVGVSTLILAMTLSACASGVAKRDPNVVGGSYLVVRYEGLPARGDQPAVPAAEWTSAEFLDLQTLDASCRRQIEPQLPAAAEQIGKLGLRNLVSVGVGAAVGTGLGAIAAFTGVSFKDYALYGGLSGGGSGLGAGIAGGIDRAQIARNYAEYACMQWSVNHTAEKSGRLDGIGILPYAGVGRARGVTDPGGASNQRGTPTDHRGGAVAPLP